MNILLEKQIQKYKEALLAKLNHLVIGERKRYIEQYKQGDNVRYYTAKRILKDEVVIAHLEGKRTVGCYYIGKLSKFLCFDIDEPDPSIPLQLLKILKDMGFRSNELHIENSGSKGWHIWLFFEEPIPISRLTRFGKVIIAELGSMGSRIELRPEQSESSRGIKLPFAIHRKTMVRTTYLQHNLLFQENAIEYFLNIEPMGKERFEFLTNDLFAEQLQDDTPTIECSKSKVENNYSTKPNVLKGTPLHLAAEKLLHDGIPERGIEDKQGRHFYQFLIALYFKEQGYSEQETAHKVTEWALREKQYQRAKSSEDEIRQDVANDIHHIYCKDKKLFIPRQKEISVSYADIQLVQEIHDPVTQQIAWAILVLGRMFQKEGQVYFSIRQLVAMTGFSRNTVHRRLQVLIEANFIQLIQNGQYKSSKSMASLYVIPALLRDAESDTFIIPIKSTQWDEIFDETFDIFNSQRLTLESHQGIAE
ncbi:DNA-binding transcriptional regulator YhcF (GntR family) [Paenibacillus turicensis]|uniref:DNA-binding transcriptional regulator YhcF (GntR family) n=1 Tax=Paenibacillus turicensis TaxID=160487 RepID=A0ABS4FUT0_9BACL|nr:hypothetical protein [Paenibacillus turicensis]MBP1906315.1 DNA-binding transcriptional regulator YhcF (GntR family) [Paenibacillus turicensis]